MTIVDPRQRVVINVPNPETVLVLGSRHYADIGYEGITGHTKGHILLKGVGDESTVTIETPKQVMLHSTAHTLTAFAAGDMLLGSEENNYITARRNIFIAAGATGPQHPGVGWYTDPKPIESVPISKMAAQIDSVIDDARTIALVGTIASTVISGAGFLLGKTWDMVSGIVGAAQIGVVAASQTLSPDYTNRVHIHGNAKAFLTAGEDVNLSALQSINMMSPQWITGTAGIAASLVALGSASLTGAFSAGVTGFVRADLFSAKTVGLTSRFGNIEMLGKTITIGQSVTPFPQAPTSSVEVRAAKGIDLSIGTVGPSKAVAHLNADGFTATGGTHTLTADKGVSLSVGTFGLNAATDGISMTRALPDVAKRLTDAANAAYSATRATADAAIQNLVNVAGGRGASIPMLTVAAAYELYLTQMRAAKATLEAQLKTARMAAAAVLRVAVTNREAHVSNGLSKVAVDAMGRIVIDGGIMPIVIKTGASSIELTPASIKLTSLSIVEG